MQYDLSVIIPIFNVENYLERCIQSILEQSFQNFELLLVDDGSTDGSAAICDRFADADHRVRVIHKENGGTASSVREGILAAQAPYVCFSDSDDYVDADYLEKLYRGITDNDADISQCGYEHQSSEGTNVHIYPFRIIDEDEIKAILKDAANVYTGSVFPGMNSARWGKVYRAEIARKALEFYPQGVRIYEDVLFNYSALHYSRKVVVLDTPPLYHWCYRPGSTTTSLAAKIILGMERFTACMKQAAEAYGYPADRADFVKNCVYADNLYGVASADRSYKDRRADIKQITGAMDCKFWREIIDQMDSPRARFWAKLLYHGQTDLALLMADTWKLLR